jgi:hypothetical protein
MEKKIEIEFSNGTKIQVEEKNILKMFGDLQEEYKSAIISIDGQEPAFYGMTDEEIEKEFTRIRELKIENRNKN